MAEFEMYGFIKRFCRRAVSRLKTTMVNPKHSQIYKLSGLLDAVIKSLNKLWFEYEFKVLYK